MATRKTLAMFEHGTGHAVYLRPTNAGLTVVSLDPSTPAMVGVGTGNCCINALPPSADEVEAAATAFRVKVATMGRSSVEERYALSRIRAALNSQLALRDGLLFLHQEWRFSSSDKLDILALDESSGRLVVIEIKKSEAAALRTRDAKGRTAAEQAALYVGLLARGRDEYVPFFQRLAAALARIYRPDGPIPRIDRALPPRWEVWWPDGSISGPSEVVAPRTQPDVCFVAKDTAWQSELRRRQSRWREERGYAIGLHRGRPLGSRLAMPSAEEKLWNFLNPAIGELARREYLANASRSRARQKVYGYPRLFDDLLSSQPLVFNLFGGLALDLESATAAARQLWPERVHTVTRIEIEWSPGRWDPRYLDNGTAADVAIFHTTPRGGAGVICVEAKYHEDLAGEEYALKPRYFDIARSSGAFLEDAIPALGRRPLQQLWFDHLLALAVQATDGLETALFVVVHPMVNAACGNTLPEYRRGLSTSGVTSFDVKTLEELVPIVGGVLGREWEHAFTARYLRSSAANVRA